LRKQAAKNASKAMALEQKQARQDKYNKAGLACL